MKPKQILKIITDIAMTVTLLLLMAYSLVGEAAHEWLGIGMFVLFILFSCDTNAQIEAVLNAADRLLKYSIHPYRLFTPRKKPILIPLRSG